MTLKGECDYEKCAYPKCRLCEDNCLMEYIDLSTDPPKFSSEGDRCDMWMGCTFCEMICPTGAISCNWEEILAETAGLGDLMGYNPLERAAEEAEATGRLRRLVHRETKGPFVMVHKKRPRFKLPKDD